MVLEYFGEQLTISVFSGLYVSTYFLGEIVVYTIGFLTIVCSIVLFSLVTIFSSALFVSYLGSSSNSSFCEGWITLKLNVDWEYFWYSSIELEASSSSESEFLFLKRLWRSCCCLIKSFIITLSGRFGFLPCFKIWNFFSPSVKK